MNIVINKLHSNQACCLQQVTIINLCMQNTAALKKYACYLQQAAQNDLYFMNIVNSKLQSKNEAYCLQQIAISDLCIQSTAETKQYACYLQQTAQNLLYFMNIVNNKSVKSSLCIQKIVVIDLCVQSTADLDSRPIIYLLLQLFVVYILATVLAKNICHVSKAKRLLLKFKGPFCILSKRDVSSWIIALHCRKYRG